jgi:hypothetical protein
MVFEHPDVDKNMRIAITADSLRSLMLYSHDDRDPPHSGAPGLYRNL